MERLHGIIQVTTPYLVLAALAVVSVQRVTESPAPAQAPSIVQPASRVTEARVVHVYDDRAAPPRPQEVVVAATEPEPEEEEPEDERDADAQAELRAQHLERGHALVDGMLDLGVAEAEAADELRSIAEMLPHAERGELYARITRAVNDDELEVDPDHLPL